jgi:hypothetical protein
MLCSEPGVRRYPADGRGILPSATPVAAGAEWRAAGATRRLSCPLDCASHSDFFAQIRYEPSQVVAPGSVPANNA